MSNLTLQEIRRDRVSRICTVAGAALVVAALVFDARAGATTTRTLQLRAPAREAIAMIAGTGVRSRCTIPPSDMGLVEALGHADWDTRLIELRPVICKNVNALSSAPATAYSRRSFTQAQALLVLVHEAVHLSAYEGGRDEALTECRAIQLMRETALTLGVGEATARALGHEALRFDARLPGPGNWMVGLHEIPNYHAPDCYDGGTLDTHPESNDWPN